MQQIMQALEFLHHRGYGLLCFGFVFAIHADFHQRAENIALFLVSREFFLAAGGEEKRK